MGAASTFTVTTTGSPTPSLTEKGALPEWVTFTDNGDGTAALTGTPAAPGGTYNLTFTASNGVGNPATENFTLTVNPSGIATTTTLTSSTNPSLFGQSVTFTATVAPLSGRGTPTGSVTFYAGSTALGTATLSSKKASLKTTSVPVGSQAITAVYSGDTNYTLGTSAVLTQTVNPDLTTTKVTSSANPSVHGQSVTLTATVKAASPGSRHAEGHGDVLRRHDESRQRYSQRWDGHSPDHILGRRVALDHG